MDLIHTESDRLNNSAKKVTEEVERRVGVSFWIGPEVVFERHGADFGDCHAIIVMSLYNIALIYPEDLGGLPAVLVGTTRAMHDIL